eukprot:GFUD01004331.1.p1 GENE.GFUD01004331.1~~GFUD01004331.1.p1  ORF type:complete len:731 (+),score=135.58 GFUD01004331.1:71-2263(+)
MHGLTLGLSVLWILNPFSPVEASKNASVKCEELGPDLEDLSSSGTFDHLGENTQCLKDIHPSMKLYTKNIPEGCLLTGKDQQNYYTDISECSEEVKRVSKFAFLVHGFMPLQSSHSSSNLIGEWIDMKNKIVKEENTGAVMVDWRYGADADIEFLFKNNLMEILEDLLNLKPYQQAAANTRYVGAAIARIMEQIYQKNQQASFHCIGHSLGAHTCGFAGKAFRKISRMSLKRISGLDPVKPLFLNDDRISQQARLYRTDAETVDIIHTDSMLFGSFEPIGHFDFYPGSENKFGYDQPEAGVFGSHLSAIFIYMSTIGPKPCNATHICSSSVTNAGVQGCQVTKDAPAIGYNLQSVNSKNGIYAIEVKNKHLECFSPNVTKTLAIENYGNMNDQFGIMTAAKLALRFIDEAQKIVDDKIQGLELMIGALRRSATKMKKEEQKLLTNISIEFEVAQSKIIDARMNLKFLAKETMQRSDSLIKFLEAYKTNKKYRKYIFKRIANLLEKSAQFLTEAEKTYKIVDRHYINIKEYLKSFDHNFIQRLTESLKDTKSEKETVDKVGTLAVAGVILGCPVAVIANLAIPGTGLFEYVTLTVCGSAFSLTFGAAVKSVGFEADVSTLQADIASTVQNVKNQMENIEQHISTLRKEKQIAMDWKNHLDNMVHRGDLAELADAIDENLSLIVDEAIAEYKGLKCYAKNYFTFRICLEKCNDTCGDECKKGSKPCALADDL